MMFYCGCLCIENHCNDTMVLYFSKGLSVETIAEQIDVYDLWIYVDSIAVSVFADIFIELTNTVSEGRSK